MTLLCIKFMCGHCECNIDVSLGNSSGDFFIFIFSNFT